MSIEKTRSHTTAADESGQTLAAILRRQVPNQSWSQVRGLIEARRVRLNGEPCLDPARRLKEGDVVEFLDRPAPKPREHDDIVIRHLDEHLVVVEKPSGLSTVRHPSERAWNSRRKALSPTLEDLVPKRIAAREGRQRKGPLPRLRIVQRLDKETSGLLVFARSVHAERELGRQFRKHTVERRYLALIPGALTPRTVTSYLVRDRGDGRRGSTSNRELGKVAITHVEIVESLPGYSLVACRLETGRTHQIRIHLAELGHPVCGEKVYNRTLRDKPILDASKSPRLFLHAAELGFLHPATGRSLHWTMPLPSDLRDVLTSLRNHEA